MADLQQILAGWVDVTDGDSDPCPPAAIEFLKQFCFQIRDREALTMLQHTKAQPSAECHATAGVLNLKVGDLLLFKDSRVPEQIEPPPIDEGSESKGDGTLVSVSSRLRNRSKQRGRQLDPDGQMDRTQWTWRNEWMQSRRRVLAYRGRPRCDVRNGLLVRCVLQHTTCLVASVIPSCALGVEQEHHSDCH